MQGEVISFEVTVSSITFQKTEKLEPTQSFVVIENLKPRTDYSVIVKLIINGGESISSPAIKVTTPEGSK